MHDHVCPSHTQTVTFGGGGATMPELPPMPGAPAIGAARSAPGDDGGASHHATLVHVESSHRHPLVES